MHPKPYPGQSVTVAIFLVLLLGMVASATWLLGVDDQVYLKQLIEDEGPVQLVGQTAIFIAFGLACLFVLVDGQRRVAYTQLSYLLMFYALREADYHYKVSEHAKATQFKRFFSHELIPLSSKLFLAAIVILFLVVLYRYLKTQAPTFKAALRGRLPWALFALAWAGVFFLSQAVDQIPVFHNVTGQVFEEIFESSAEVLVLTAMILFRVQLRAPGASPARSPG
ncbi:hypothetical protein F0M18_18825 [Pseudohalioglobus sediminis]|uniref:Uncharacterized protein n=1 Tax=Pseudohalioglobus sediminis TaxID=2606449 RepID=A0A5B0WNG4_9GAMM|nr:hypothetical protein [Pseudohalioglobus sediminis]KAA1188542.1 hypothetical protein F0M18_18825 [Pseudohalioglobus sediminis]